MSPDAGDLAQMTKNYVYHPGKSWSSERTDWTETKTIHCSNVLRIKVPLVCRVPHTENCSPSTSMVLGVPKAVVHLGGPLLPWGLGPLAFVSFLIIFFVHHCCFLTLPLFQGVRKLLFRSD